MYDPAERLDPLPGTRDNSETNTHAEDSGGKYKYGGHAAHDDARETNAKPCEADPDTGYSKTAGE